MICAVVYYQYVQERSVKRERLERRMKKREKKKKERRTKVEWHRSRLKQSDAAVRKRERASHRHSNKQVFNFRKAQLKSSLQLWGYEWLHHRGAARLPYLQTSRPLPTARRERASCSPKAAVCDAWAQDACPKNQQKHSSSTCGTAYPLRQLLTVRRAAPPSDAASKGRV